MVQLPSDLDPRVRRGGASGAGMLPGTRSSSVTVDREYTLISDGRVSGSSSASLMDTSARLAPRPDVVVVRLRMLEECGLVLTLESDRGRSRSRSRSFGRCSMLDSLRRKTLPLPLGSTGGERELLVASDAEELDRAGSGVRDERFNGATFLYAVGGWGEGRGDGESDVVGDTPVSRLALDELAPTSELGPPRPLPRKSTGLPRSANCA